MHDQDHMREARRRIAKMRDQTNRSLRNTRKSMFGTPGQVEALEKRLEDLREMDQYIVDSWTASTRSERFGDKAATAMSKGGLSTKGKDKDVMEILIMIGAVPKKKPASKKKKT